MLEFKRRWEVQGSVNDWKKFRFLLLIGQELKIENLNRKLFEEILLFQLEDLNRQMFSTYNDILPASSTTQLINNKLKHTSLVFPTEAMKMDNKHKEQQQQRTRGRPFRIPLEPLKEGHLMDPMERMFLEAVERGDKQTVLRCLRGARAVNVNCTNMLGRSAIQVRSFQVLLPYFLEDLQSSTLEIPCIGKFPMKNTVWCFISRTKYHSHHLIRPIFRRAPPTCRLNGANNWILKTLLRLNYHKLSTVILE